VVGYGLVRGGDVEKCVFCEWGLGKFCGFFVSLVV